MGFNGSKVLIKLLLVIGRGQTNSGLACSDIAAAILPFPRMLETLPTRTVVCFSLSFILFGLFSSHYGVGLAVGIASGSTCKLGQTA
jgi:hypothetical protein